MKAIDYLVGLIRGREGEWKVKDLMTDNVIIIEPEATVHDAVDKMRSHGIHGLIVAKDKQPVGMISTYDILLLMARREHGKDVKVEEVMSTELITTTPDEDIVETVELMLKNHILRLPVLEDGKLVGILTRSDLINAFDKGFHGERPEETKVGTELRVENIMHKLVITIDPNKSVLDAARLMSEKNIGSLVISNKCEIGILTESDIFKKVVAEGKDSKETKVADIMTSHCKTVDPKMDIFQASKILHDQDIRRLPVVENCEVVGIATAEDIIDAISLRRRL